MNKEIKVKALVIKKNDYGEADRVIKILSEDYGKLDVIIKGIRKSKRRDKAAVDILTLTEFVLNRTSNRVIAKSFETINPFIKLRMDLFKMNASYYILTILNEIEVENSIKRKLAKLSFNSIEYISKEDNKNNIILLLVYYVSKIIQFEGLNFHISTGNIFDLSRGQINNSKVQDSVRLTEEDRGYLLLLNSVDIEGINELKSRENMHYRILEILEKYLNYHMSTNINIARLIGRNYLDEFS